jgi:hypothetical protein
MPTPITIINGILRQVEGLYTHFLSPRKQKKTITMIVFFRAWQRPTLTGTKSQLPSALRSLTSVFGMGTGVTFSP